MKSEIDWLTEQIEYCKCFINIPLNDKKHREIVQSYLKSFTDRLNNCLKGVKK